MAGYSARQSSFSSGDTITAAHSNDEFNTILAAFNVSTGHTHDGSTAGDGGPISKLFSNTITFGTNANTDIAVTFDGSSNDGVLTWMEDEDYFQFSDDILLTTTEKLQFRDTAIYIHSSADGQLDLVADTEIQIAATTVDINGAVDVSGNLGVGGNLTVTGTTTFNGGTLTLGDADTDNIVFGGEVDSNIIPDDDDTYDLGSSSKEWQDLFIDGTAKVDTLTVDENATVAGTLGVTGVLTANAGVVIDNITIDGTTMSLSSNNLTFDSSEDIVLDADDGDILLKDGGTLFGTLNSGGGSNLNIKSGSTQAIALSGANATFSGTVTAVGTSVFTNLDISGDVDIDGTLETDALSINGTAVTSTAAELNILDGVTSTAAELNLLDGKAFLDEDNMASNSATGIASQQSIKAYVDAQITAEDLDITTDSGTIAIDLDSETLTVSGGTGLDSSATGNAVTLAIDSTVATLTGSQTLTNKSLTTPTLTGTAVVASLDISGDIDVDGTTNLDVVDIDGAVDFASTTAHAGTASFVDNAKIILGTGNDLEIYHDGSDSYIVDDGAGLLFVRGSSGIRLQGANGEAMIHTVENGSVELYHDNSSKLATTGSGIDVTGLVEFDSISGTGSVAITDIADEDDMSSNSATQLATQQSIKAYADTKATPGFAVAMAIAL